MHDMIDLYDKMMRQSWSRGESVRLPPMRSGIHSGLLPYVASRVFLWFSGFPPLNKQTYPNFNYIG